MMGSTSVSTHPHPQLTRISVDWLPRYRSAFQPSALCVLSTTSPPTSLKTRVDAQSQLAHQHRCFLYSVCSKASKEAGKALVAKAPSPPFESQHNHLLHCLEKTTVRYLFFLKLKSPLEKKNAISLTSFILTILVTDSSPLKPSVYEK